MSGADGSGAAPLTLDSADCRLLGGLARDAMLVPTVGHTFRFGPAVPNLTEAAHA